MTITEENELTEKIAKLLDEYLETTVADLTNINNLVGLEKQEARTQQQLQNNLDKIRDIIINEGGVEYSNKKLKEISESAIEKLHVFKDETLKDTFISILEFNINRNM